MKLAGVIWVLGVGWASAASFAAQPEVAQEPRVLDEPVAREKGSWVPGGGVPKWRVRFEPSLAFMSASGEFQFPGGGVAGSTTFELEEINLDSPRPSPLVELHIAKDKSRITLEGWALSTSRDTFAMEDAQLGPGRIAAGEQLSLSLEYETFALLGSHRVWSRSTVEPADRAPDARFGVDLVAGLRFHRVDADAMPTFGFTTPPPTGATSVTVDELFAEPVFGTRVELDISDYLTVEGRAMGGGFSFGDRSSTSANIAVSFTYRPIPEVGIQTGYRLLVFSLQSGSGNDQFEWSGAVAGLYWGVSLTF